MTATVVSGALAVGCSEKRIDNQSDVSLKVSPSELKFRADGETRTVSVDTEEEWSYGMIEPEGNRSICRCEKTAGGLDVTMSAATGSEERYVRLIVKARQEIRTVMAKQEGISLETDTDSLEFGPEGGRQEVNVKCNLTGWDFLVSGPEGTVVRCTAERQRNKLVVTVPSVSEGDSGFDASITVRAGKLSRKIAVRQRPLP